MSVATIAELLEWSLADGADYDVSSWLHNLLTIDTSSIERRISRKLRGVTIECGSFVHASELRALAVALLKISEETGAGGQLVVPVERAK